MPQLSELKTNAQLREELLRDPEVRAEYDRTAFAQLWPCAWCATGRSMISRRLRWLVS